MVKILSKEFFHDKRVLFFSIFNLIFGFLIVIYVMLGTKPQELELPVRYTQYGTSPIELGDWFTSYELAIFAGVMTLLNLALAARVHRLNRFLSVTVISFNFIIMAFLFIVSRSIIGLSPSA